MAIHEIFLGFAAMRHRVIKAWADIGSKGGIFEFVAGPVWSMYGPLMHIWSKKISADLKLVEIRFVKPKRKRTK